jgi:hypothetical protein
MCVSESPEVPSAAAPRSSSPRALARPDAGQATAEYALVLLGAAAVALLLIGWATTTDQVSRLFDYVVDQVIGRSG